MNRTDNNSFDSLDCNQLFNFFGMNQNNSVSSLLFTFGLVFSDWNQLINFFVMNQNDLFDAF
jgi:hypothetical protein